MKRYSVTVKEVHERVVTVEAANEQEAYDKALNSEDGELAYSWTLDPDVDCDVTELVED